MTNTVESFSRVSASTSRATSNSCRPVQPRPIAARFLSRSARFSVGLSLTSLLLSKTRLMPLNLALCLGDFLPVIASGIGRFLFPRDHARLEIALRLLGDLGQHERTASLRFAASPKREHETVGGAI